MITKDLVDIYRSFGGDIDGVLRIGKPHQKQMVSDNDWGLIESIIQDLRLIKKGTISDEYKEAVERELLDKFDIDGANAVRILSAE